MVSYTEEYVRSVNKLADEIHGMKIEIGYNDDLTNLRLGTIDPECTVASGDNKSITLHANSDGPICPMSHIKSPLRIMWILKESYVQLQSIISDNDRGGHYQSLDRNENPITEGEGDMTYKTIIQVTNEVYRRLGWNFTDEFTPFRKSVSIVNLNKFPCIGNKTNPALLAKWGKRNENLLIHQIKTYRPHIIIGGNTLNTILMNNGLEHRPSKISSDFDILGYRIPKDNVLEENGNFLYFNDDIIFINAYHPSNSWRIKDYIPHLVDNIFNALNREKNSRAKLPIDRVIERVTEGEGLIDLDGDSLSYLYDASEVEAYFMSSDRMEGIGRMGEIMDQLRRKCYADLHKFKRITLCVECSSEAPATMEEIAELDKFFADLNIDSNDGSDLEVMWGAYHRPLKGNNIELACVISR